MLEQILQDYTIAMTENYKYFINCARIINKFCHM